MSENLAEPVEPDDTGWEQSEDLDQMQEEDTLVDRGVDDVLDEGYTAGEKWGPGEGFGSTAAETEQGETLDQRVAQEIPEPDPYVQAETETETDEEAVDGEVGDDRAGRLVDPDEGLGEDVDKDLVAGDVGIDGAGAGAEEAAVHVVDEDDPAGL